MNKKFALILILSITVVVAGIFFSRKQTNYKANSITINEITVPPVPTLDADEVVLGKVIYSQYCASCHGAELEGVPNWKVTQPDGTLLAPPHDSSGHTWHHPDALLLQIISEGGLPENGNMPGFNGVLSEDEMRTALAFIKTFWGVEEREFQWWISYTQNSFYE